VKGHTVQAQSAFPVARIWKAAFSIHVPATHTTTRRMITFNTRTGFQSYSSIMHLLEAAQQVQQRTAAAFTLSEDVFTPAHIATHFSASV
jgi:hypothetical protein